MIATDGLEAAESWAEGIVANMARKPQGGDTDQIKAVASGECDVAVANHYYLARLMRSDKEEDKAVADAVGIIFPNQDGRGAHANISAAGVTAHAPHKDAAIQFIEYLATPNAQAYFAEGNNEWPVVEGVKLSPVLEAWGDFKTDAVSVIAYGENNAEALKAMDRAGWQ
jgi:iron(III) transport system substrate-binding protein